MMTFVGPPATVELALSLEGTSIHLHHFAAQSAKVVRAIIDKNIDLLMLGEYEYLSLSQYEHISSRIITMQLELSYDNDASRIVICAGFSPADLLYEYNI